METKDDPKAIALAVVEEIRRQIKQKNRKLTFMLVGRTGVGKSSTINSLLGQEVAPVGKYRPTTMEVETYPHEHSGTNYVVVDTPGLCDDLPEAGNDARYIAKIKSQIEQVDTLWYVTGLDDTRLSGDEKRGIKLVSDALSGDVWKRAVIVFTRADKVDAEDYQEALAERTAIVREEIAKYAPDFADDIPAVAVSNVDSVLPNGKEWLGELFTVVFTRFSEAGAVPFIVSLKKDLSPETSAGATEAGAEKKSKPRITLDENQKERVRNALIEKVVGGAATGAGLGIKYGSKFGPVGTAIGAVAGGIVGGAIGWLFK